MLMSGKIRDELGYGRHNTRLIVVVLTVQTINSSTYLAQFEDSILPEELCVC
jgi:hypothetical protein